MDPRITGKDIEVLACLADYQLLSSTQVTALHYSREKVARRRLGQLREAGLVLERDRGFGRERGRPSKLYGLAEAGHRLLVEKGLQPSPVGFESIAAEKIACVDHLLLLNWFRIHLVALERRRRIVVKLVSSTSPTGTWSSSSSAGPATRPTGESPFLFIDPAGEGEPCGKQEPFVPSRFPSGEGTNGERKWLRPDAVFSITDLDQEKSVLLFLEVDMGSESLAKPKRGPGDVRDKIVKYQHLARSGSYKRFESVFGAPFNGFRLLFLANSPGQAAALCRLTQEMRPSNFIWVSDQERMFGQGLGDAIWAPGGSQSLPAESLQSSSMSGPAPFLPPPV